jgi:hypothetical protein
MFGLDKLSSRASAHCAVTLGVIAFLAILTCALLD